MIILEDVKSSLGVDVNNLGFDSELLMYVNSVRATLVQLGVSDLELDTVTVDTEWPVFDSLVLQDTVKHYIVLRVKESFDPIANQAIAETMSSQATILEGRIAHEIEVQNVVI